MLFFPGSSINMARMKIGVMERARGFGNSLRRAVGVEMAEDEIYYPDV